jgi:hypothetical protein
LAATLTVVVVGALGGAAPALGATMVGKGSGRLGGTTNPLQTYAYIIPCSSPVGSSPPFEVRVEGFDVRFRLTSVSSVQCTGATTAPAGFTTQTGTATGIISGGGPPTVSGTVSWQFIDGGPGGASDRVLIFVRETVSGSPRMFIDQTPPGPFPGSDQPTGFNTALAR